LFYFYFYYGVLLLSQPKKTYPSGKLIGSFVSQFNSNEITSRTGFPFILTQALQLHLVVLSSLSQDTNKKMIAIINNSFYIITNLHFYLIP